MLFGYPWPGNVRELSNVIERAAILAAAETITQDHLPHELRGAEAAPTDLRLALQAAERQHIAFVLSATGGAREKAAALLGIDPATLYRKAVRYGLD
jgi:DNA-binding NtrC family response regulator